MKKKRMFSYNPLLILAIVVLSGSVYKAQLTHDSSELKIVNPVDANYVSGSLVESSKDILIETIYTDGKSDEFKQFLLNLPSRVLIYLNDNWIEFVDTENEDYIWEYVEESDEVLISAINSDNVTLLQNDFYGILGEILYKNSLEEPLLKKVENSYSKEAVDFVNEEILKIDYFKLCITLYFIDSQTLEKSPQSYEMIEGILQVVGII